MAALPFQVDELTSTHLDALITAEATEGQNLEFKSEPYGQDHDGVREFLKDVTAMANTAGGFLLIGVRDEQGVAKAVSPIVSPDSDKLKQRLESLLQTAVEPRIFGVRMHPIIVPGGYVLAIRVPRTATPPHRVTAKSSNRFWLRSSAGAYEASMEDLRRLFGETGDVRNRVMNFREERVHAVLRDKGPYRLADGDRLLVDVIPLSSQTFPQPINVARAYENHVEETRFNALPVRTKNANVLVDVGWGNPLWGNCAAAYGSSSNVQKDVIGLNSGGGHLSVSVFVDKNYVFQSQAVEVNILASKQHNSRGDVRACSPKRRLAAPDLIHDELQP